VTGGDDGDGHLIVRLDTGETFVSPDGWPQLPPPESGETVAAFWDRAIIGDAFLQSITARTSRGQKVPRLDGRYPAELTLAWWEKTWPYREFSRIFNESPGNYHRDRVYWRLGVEVVARWEAGYLMVKGRRMDDPSSPLVEVDRDLFRFPFMVLRPHAPGGGWFRSEKWRGNEPPQDLPWYYELTVWPAETPEQTTTAAVAENKKPRKATDEEIDDFIALQDDNRTDNAPLNRAALRETWRPHFKARGLEVKQERIEDRFLTDVHKHRRGRSGPRPKKQT
jgi:hypothetical protein